MLVVDDLFIERNADPLRYAAVDLALDDERIDQPAAILGDGETIDAHLVGFRVDFQRGDVCGRRGRAEDRIVGFGGGEFVAGLRRQPRQVRIDRTRDLAERDRTIGAGDGDFSVFGDKVGGRRLEKVRRGVEQLLAHRLRRQCRRAAGQHHAAAGIGAGAAGNGRAVALHDANVFEAGAEMLGDDLGERRFQALPMRGDAERSGDAAT